MDTVWIVIFGQDDNETIMGRYKNRQEAMIYAEEVVHKKGIRNERYIKGEMSGSVIWKTGPIYILLDELEVK